ncbi:MAG: ABC transporter ATP-binding protein [Alphaproteobacteria bacterium]|nr:ABC transporter ATP-binding protein [Alphaproteobacteria bacterium]TAD89641.1 MAG: ABC transporter ATP-binding protein [Alphaproteobacteria bacterium]
MIPHTLSPPALAVRCAGVVKSFGTDETLVRVLHGIDLDIPAGELTMLVGPSGCGKTTLLSIIAGILSFEEGEASIFGTPIHSLKGADLVRFRRQTLGFIFQQYNLLPALSASENAAVPLLAAGVGRVTAIRRAEELLAQLGLGAHLKKLPNQLSGGQQQRVAIARALVHNPKLVVCDEPTAALDAQSGQTVMALLRDAALAPDRGVIVVTHDNRIYSYADRIAEMSDGRITRVARTPAQKVA